MCDNLCRTTSLEQIRQEAKDIVYASTTEELNKRLISRNIAKKKVKKMKYAYEIGIQNGIGVKQLERLFYEKKKEGIYTLFYFCVIYKTEFVESVMLFAACNHTFAARDEVMDKMLVILHGLESYGETAEIRLAEVEKIIK